MEVKSVFMDLKEGVKKGNVRTLESEAFKKPIELKIGYDDNDKKQLLEIKKSCEAMEEAVEFNLTEIEKKEAKAEELIKKYQKEIAIKDKVIKQLEEEVEKTDERQDSLSDKIEEQNKTIKSLSGELCNLKKTLDEFEKKITKQPKVFHDKIFISGNEEVMLGVYDIPDGDYLQILSIKIGEHNEYCENKDEVLIDKVHSQDGYTPRYCLYGGTDLDTPTAMVYYDLVLIPL